MHVLIKVKSSNNISKWQVGFNSAFKGLMPSRPFEIEYEKPELKFGGSVSYDKRKMKSLSDGEFIKY
jgi:hypothetical protein